jgi:hypothetical protein
MFNFALMSSLLVEIVGFATALQSTCSVTPTISAAQAKIIVDRHNDLRRGEGAKNMAKLVSLEKMTLFSL